MHDIRSCLILVTAGLVCGGSAESVNAEEPPKSRRPAIYDRKADGAAQIEQALRVAQRDHKRVLLQFGANWCVWCHRLHELCETDKVIGKLLRDHYEVVLVDVDTVDGRRHNDEIDARYGRPTRHGLPVLVVLDAEGKALVTQETGSLEDGLAHVPGRVIAFLKKWQAPVPPAAQVLAQAQARAARESKQVFVVFSAPWCTWCHRLSDYLARPAVARAIDQRLVPVTIDIERMAGGKVLQNKFRGTEDRGIPFFVVLDRTGAVVADANGKTPKGAVGNVGFPVDDWEVAHFMKVMTELKPGFTPEQLKVIKDELHAAGKSTH